MDKRLVFIAVTVLVLLNLYTFWTDDVVKIEEPLHHYEGRHEITNLLPVSQCNKSSRNLIGYESDNRDKALIIYSEMPKCGSGTFVRILSDVCKYSKHYRTKYTWPTPSPFELQSVESKQKYISSKILPLRPYIFMGHLSFMDFTELGYKQPLYIDIVRDPVERWISLYYYKRVAPFHIKRLKLTQKEKSQTIEYCIKNWISLTGCLGRSVKATAECLKTEPYKGCKDEKIVSRYPIWFSGQYINPSLVSLQRAKTNIEKYYTFIGITEHFDETLKAIETILPSFTNELTRIYKTVENGNVGHNKVRPSDESIAVMKELLSDDYELYGFIRQRFYKHLNCLAINITKH
ncbi:unnamed protein product [Owenia fusiformis]|uniref:Sulfotransferase n=1 Tax=Owenia fusiformis TaxID=6347 RepID=A0A8S4PUY4_OWEFU|nr:unnamed protein product [Owenia fusiformis]